MNQTCPSGEFIRACVVMDLFSPLQKENYYQCTHVPPVICNYMCKLCLSHTSI